MRKLAVACWLVLLLAVVSAVPAWGSTPVGAGTYRGSGAQYFNNAPCPHSKGQCYRSRAGSESFSFKVPAGQRQLADLVAPYDYYCGAGHAVAHVARISIGPKGAFGYRFSSPSRGLNGKVNGTATLTVGGQFAPGGRAATVTYTILITFTGERYTCGTRVTGTARLV